MSMNVTQKLIKWHLIHGDMALISLPCEPSKSKRACCIGVMPVHASVTAPILALDTWRAYFANTPRV